MRRIEHIWLVYVLIFLGLIGLLDATYLTASHFGDTAVTCSLFEGCDVVLQSRYATIAGIPIALLGGIYYFSIFAGATIGYVLRRRDIIRGVAYLTIIGFLVSLVLVYIQIWMIGSLCQFCIISAVISTLLFICGILIIRGKKGGNITSSLNEAQTEQ
ncbi:MAG: vitamin K epoxide reductase family protein [Candidatus Paceibacterota bacterium]